MKPRIKDYPDAYHAYRFEKARERVIRAAKRFNKEWPGAGDQINHAVNALNNLESRTSNVSRKRKI